MRTQTPMSLNTPHTGIQYYDPNTPKIPVAALSPEDADLIARLAKTGKLLPLTITKYSVTPFLQLSMSRNQKNAQLSIYYENFRRSSQNFSQNRGFITWNRSVSEYYWRI